MKGNYRSWEIRINDFPESAPVTEQAKFLLRFAILAPSGHNSQPWEFSVEGGVISVWANKDRSLAESDPKGRQLAISIGCAIENLAIAADYFGFNFEVSYNDERKKDTPSLFAKVVLNKVRDKVGDKDHLIFSIHRRLTNRNKYKREFPPLDFLGKIKDLSSDEIHIAVVTEKLEKVALADISLASQIEIMDNNSFRDELSHYIKSNFTRSGTGMPGFTVGIPAPVSFFASKLVRKINMSRKSQRQDEKLFKEYTPAFVIMSTKKDERSDWLHAGRFFEKIWLTATRAGISCAPLAAPVQVGEYYKELQKILHITFRPQIFFRVGYAQKPARHSPRLSVGDVLR